MTRTERLLRLARQRGDRAAELILDRRCNPKHDFRGGSRYREPQCARCGMRWEQFATPIRQRWTEAELRAAWGDR